MSQTASQTSRYHFFALLPLFAALAANYYVFVTQLDLSYIDGFLSALIWGMTADLSIIAGCWAMLFGISSVLVAQSLFSFGLTTALFLIIADAICFHFSLARLNTGVLHDINYYAIKAVLTVSDVLVLAVLIGGVGFFAWLCFKSAGIFKISTPTPLSRRYFTLSLLIIMLGLATQLIPHSYDETAGNLFWIDELTQLNKNSFLKNLKIGVFRNIFNATPAGSSLSWKAYQDGDEIELRNMGLISAPTPESATNVPIRPFRKVVIIAQESLALDYFHSINPDIPAAASDFLDELMRRFPAARNFRCSTYPTLHGLISLLFSRVPAQYHLMRDTGATSLFQLMQQQHGSRGFLIDGLSRFYGGENVIVRKVMGVEKYIAYEDLAEEYPEPPVNSWGFHDDVVLDKALKIMKENLGSSYIMLVKTIDMHQPPSYCGIPLDKLPSEVASHSNQVVRSIYWTNNCLRQFFSAVEGAGLLDEETLIVVTADHYPMPNYGHSDLVHGEYYLFNRLPLILASGRKEPLPGFDSDRLACQLDVAPTICRLTGTLPAASFMGYSLIDKVSLPRALGFYNNVFNLETASGAVNFPVNLSPREYPAIARWINNTFSTPAQH